MGSWGWLYLRCKSDACQDVRGARSRHDPVGRLSALPSHWKPATSYQSWTVRAISEHRRRTRLPNPADSGHRTITIWAQEDLACLGRRGREPSESKPLGTTGERPSARVGVNPSTITVRLDSHDTIASVMAGPPAEEPMERSRHPEPARLSLRASALRPNGMALSTGFRRRAELTPWDRLAPGAAGPSVPTERPKRCLPTPPYSLSRMTPGCERPW